VKTRDSLRRKVLRSIEHTLLYIIYQRCYSSKKHRQYVDESIPKTESTRWNLSIIHNI